MAKFDSRQALKDMNELLDEVANDTFLPKRFRKIPYDKYLKYEKPRYIRYLERQIFFLEQRLKSQGSSHEPT